MLQGGQDGIGSPGIPHNTNEYVQLIDPAEADWHCMVCSVGNRSSAIKCIMCGVRRGEEYALSDFVPDEEEAAGISMDSYVLSEEGTSASCSHLFVYVYVFRQLFLLAAYLPATFCNMFVSPFVLIMYVYRFCVIFKKQKIDALQGS